MILKREAIADYGGDFNPSTKLIYLNKDSVIVFGRKYDITFTKLIGYAKWRIFGKSSIFICDTDPPCYIEERTILYNYYYGADVKFELYYKLNRVVTDVGSHVVDKVMSFLES